MKKRNQSKAICIGEVANSVICTYNENLAVRKVLTTSRISVIQKRKIARYDNNDKKFH